METIYYDTNKCMSIKSKGSNIQCSHYKKDGTDYCGIHSRAKYLVRIDSLIGATAITDEQQVQQEQPVQEVEVVKNKVKIVEDKKVGKYYYDELENIKKIDKERLLKTCEYYNQQFDENDYKQSFNSLKQYLHNLFEKYEKHTQLIIFIQRIFKGWNIRRRNKSNNKEDCGTLDSIYEIPIEYYIDYLDEDGFTYAFDIRTLELMEKRENPINPYSQKLFNQSGIFWKKYQEKVAYLKEKDGKIKYDSPKLNEEQRYHQFLIRVFQKYDMLGQYTDIKWFEEMDVNDLRKFYKSANDMFEYRAQLPDNIKKKIVKDGKFFCNFIGNLHMLKQKHKRFLQFEILREMERIVDEGEDKEYKTLGINLILTVLVEINSSAAMALPHLVQSSFG